MTFNSYIFVLCFLLISIIGYHIFVAKRKIIWAQVWLLLISLVFYAWGHILMLPFLLLEIVVNALISKLLQQNGAYRRLLLGMCIALNLGVLLYVKYYNFFLENMSLLFQFEFSAKELLVPLGISFLTFQQIAHLVDVYKGEVEDYTLLEYACYVSFFPKILSGPIALSRDFLPQLKETGRYRIHWDNIADGLQYFIIGMGKKVLLGTFLVHVRIMDMVISLS